MNGSVRILGIAGSLRRASFNRAALRAAQGLRPAGSALEVFDLDGIPPFSEDDEHGSPTRVIELKTRIREASRKSSRGGAHGAAATRRPA